ncbi:hypothetical protein [Fischerella sp. PCC 9605]|uniref:hypothetical protein n=1 Tax=Fischerella sp. PCC 9605 TaxID=1173024 RepID=UPI00047C430B|nr:hypothetical protein [Fischerella sp. PCC 9605]
MNKEEFAKQLERFERFELFLQLEQQNGAIKRLPEAETKVTNPVLVFEDDEIDKGIEVIGDYPSTPQKKRHVLTASVRDIRRGVIIQALVALGMATSLQIDAWRRTHRPELEDFHSSNLTFGMLDAGYISVVEGCLKKKHRLYQATEKGINIYIQQ